MKLFKNIMQRFEKVAAGPTITEVIEMELLRAQQEVEQARKTILGHCYLEHMALARIEAMHDWNNGKIRAHHPRWEKQG